jgi:hypothetical protein
VRGEYATLRVIIIEKLRQGTVVLCKHTKSRAMVQVVSRWSLTAEARVHARVNLSGICGGQNGTVTGFSPTSSHSPVNVIPP